MAIINVGEKLLAARAAADRALEALDSTEYEGASEWADGELYGGLFGHGDGSCVSVEHKPGDSNVLERH